MEAKRYAEAEREYREAIRLFETLPDSVRTQLDEWNYGGYLRGEYYNLACAQSRLNKRRAAVASLAAYVDCGNCDYSWMIEDPDLDNIRSERGYAETVEKAREQGDFMWILRQAGPYDSSAPTDSLPRFRYADPNDRDLVRVREYFNLDSIAGSGDELSKIRNLMHWVHNAVRHDGSSRQSDLSQRDRSDRGVPQGEPGNQLPYDGSGAQRVLSGDGFQVALRDLHAPEDGQ